MHRRCGHRGNHATVAIAVERIGALFPPASG
jgi:hypothetical protein